MDHSLVLWLLCDGKPGHENQVLGLAEAVCRKVAGEFHRIELGGSHGPWQRLRAATLAAASLPVPSWILAAGHGTHLPLCWLARRHRARSIVLMRPSLPRRWFDVCIAPEHDFPEGTADRKLILTRGALNRIRPGNGEKSGKLVLIGGPSKTHGWDGDALLAMLAHVTDSSGWEVTDSRRTPPGFLEEVRRRLPGAEVFSHALTPPGWLPEKLSAAGEVWVTEDSVSMIYEALSSGACVGLLPLPRLAAQSRVLRGVDSLVTGGYLTPYGEWERSQRLKASPQPLREADRCADLLIERFMHSSSDWK